MTWIGLPTAWRVVPAIARPTLRCSCEGVQEDPKLTLSISSSLKHDPNDLQHLVTLLSSRVSSVNALLRPPSRHQGPNGRFCAVFGFERNPMGRERQRKQRRR